MKRKGRFPNAFRRKPRLVMSTEHITVRRTATPRTLIIGENIRVVRVGRDMTLAELSAKLRRKGHVVTAPTLGFIERGEPTTMTRYTAIAEGTI